jgi:predicted phosphodiesterase
MNKMIKNVYDYYKLYPMAILCVGDIHIKPTNTHLVDLLEQQILNYIVQHQVSLVILLGDILDTFERLHTQTLNRAYQLVNRIRKWCKIAILVGNHDYINNQQFLTDQHWMNALKDWNNVCIVDKVIEEQVMNQRILLVPYVPPGRFEEALQTVQNWQNVSFIFAHQEFKGCKMGAIVSSEGDEWNLDYPPVVSGHIHDYQKPQENIYYIGASIQNSFGDQTNPRLLLIEMNIEPLFKELELCLPKKKTIYTDLDQLPVDQIQQNLETADTDMVRVVIRCDYEQFKVFTKTRQYEELVQHSKCKIVHKPPPKEEEKQKTEDELVNHPIQLNMNQPFEVLLYDKVLASKDEYIYSVYHEVVHDTSISPEDILII